MYFVDSLNISKRDFYKMTNISRGTLESKTGITEDTIGKIFAVYQNISPAWLLKGEGEMLITEISLPTIVTDKGSEYSICQLCKEKDRTIEALQKALLALEKVNNSLEVINTHSLPQTG